MPVSRHKFPATAHHGAEPSRMRARRRGFPTLLQHNQVMYATSPTHSSYRRDQSETNSGLDRDPSTGTLITLAHMADSTTDSAAPSPAPTHQADRPVYVIGGGPGGLATAYALRSSGLRVSDCLIFSW